MTFVQKDLDFSVAACAGKVVIFVSVKSRPSSTARPEVPKCGLIPIHDKDSDDNSSNNKKIIKTVITLKI